MGNNNTIPKPEHFDAPAEGLAEKMVSAPHDVLCELGGQRVHIGENAASELKRRQMLNDEISYQRKRVLALQKQQHADPVAAPDCENSHNEEPQPSPVASTPFVVLPEPGTGQVAYTLVVQSSSNHLFVPSKTDQRRPSVPAYLGNSADEYLEHDLQIKRAALESDICEIAGIQPFSLRCEKDLQPSLGSWDLDAIFSTMPTEVTPEEASLLSESLMDDSDAQKSEIILFPKRAPVCHLSGIAVVAILPVVAVLLEAEAEAERQREEERLRAIAEAQHEKDKQQLIADENTSRESIVSEEEKEIGNNTTLFREGLSRLRLLAKLPAATVTSSPLLTPSVVSGRSSPLLSPGIGPAKTPRELHDQMIAAEKQKAEDQKQALLIQLAPLQSDESRFRDEISVDHNASFDELVAGFKERYSELKAAEDLRAKEEVDALMNKVHANLIAASPAATPAGDPPSQEVEEEAPPPPLPPPPRELVPSPDLDQTTSSVDKPDEGTSNSKTDPEQKAKHARKNTLAKQLNVWKENYKSEHGKMPTKKKLLADDTISEVYQEYLALEKEIGKKSKKSTKDKKPTSEWDEQMDISEPKSLVINTRQVNDDEPTNTRYEKSSDPDSPTAEEVQQKIQPTAPTENSRYSELEASAGDDPKTAKERKHELVQQLNAWKASYTEKNGAAPTKGALRSDPSISSVYAEYEQLVKSTKASKASDTDQRRANKKKPDPRKAIVIKQLNEWKANFEQEHGKMPTKKDMKTGSDEIRSLYAEYLELTKKPDE
eukprot:TRINITY_DN3073_c0_g1_i1.p1 TRINITY_DN3073_c0_g1~~TRINITY_DN3073_c0_g1_i1.p1  ORF type:complete len:772 (+),score=215.60 TRINITY_DN3073_c0_g1_i1:52-2367(+)